MDTLSSAGSVASTSSSPAVVGGSGTHGAPRAQQEGTITRKDIEQAQARASKRRMLSRELSTFLGENTLSEFAKASILESLESRSGAVLDKRSILKTDYVPIVRYAAKDLYPVRISGAYNLRQSETTQIFGAAQPTMPGIRGILSILGAGRQNRKEPVSKQKEVLWISLREEPTVYINGRCTVLRELQHPFSNINNFQGIEGSRLEDLERRLKEDIVSEASRNNGSIILHEENRRRELEASWEAVDFDDILTPEEVFFTFRMQGYRVQYHRVPLTPEKAPTAQFFDSLTDVLMRTTPDRTIVVFNCGAGGGRSTIAMVAAGLIHMWRGIIKIPKRTKKPAISSPPDSPKKGPGEKIVRVLSGVALSSMENDLEMPESREDDGDDDDEKARHSVENITRQLEAGWYQPVLYLLRLIDLGREAKRHVDFFCQDSSHLVHLRNVIFVQRSKASRERHEPSEKVKMHRAAISLLRYVMLIAFDAYLAHQVGMLMNNEATSSTSVAQRFEFREGEDVQDGSSVEREEIINGRGSTLRRRRSAYATTRAFCQSFQDWLAERPEILRLLKEIDDNPEKALEAVGTSATLEVASGLPEKMREALLSRRGSMLNTDSLLKQDHFSSGFVQPHGDNDMLDVSFRGAQNFRKVDDTRVYGVCTPTVDAASEIALYIQNAFNATKICWINLREEPLVYINKSPFVLRSSKAPFRNLNTFTSIETDRLEAAERRLKQDVLEEAKRYSGRVLVHTESEDRSLKVLWESIADEDDVLTPLEMHESLMEAGLPVEYARVPLTPEEAPSADDVDQILRRIRLEKDSGTHFIFNCQMGRGRSTMATAIALLELERVRLQESNLSGSDDVIYDYLVSYGRSDTLHQGLEDMQVRGTTRQILNYSKKMGKSQREHIPGDYGSDEEYELSNPLPQGHFTRPDGGRTPPANGFRSNISNKSANSTDSDSVGEDVRVESDAEFGVILSLIRVLPQGPSAKKWADFVIEKCGAVENIRMNIAECIDRAATSRTSERAAEFVERGLINLRRYFVLILVAAYEMSVARDPSGDKGFATWFFDRPELGTIFKEIKGKEPLRYASDSVLSAPPPSDVDAPPTISSEVGNVVAQPPTLESAAATGTAKLDPAREVLRFVSQRNGKVLTKGAIAKSDHFPGCARLKNYEVRISGSPNFRQVSRNIKVFGTGIPTVDGLRGILEHISSGHTDSDSPICWISLREEPIIYVNGRPFVLRKLEHPFGNLEFTGISRQRVEEMEDRLKGDIINEILDNEGSFLVHDEDETGLQPVWTKVDISEGSSAIQTPRDLYKMMATEFNLVYHRVPITDEQAPKVTDYDAISKIVRNLPIDSPLVFNCQMGRGRTTTGLCVATALRLWARRELMTFPDLMEAMFAEDNSITKAKRFHFIHEMSESEQRYIRGDYAAITTLVKVLDNGNEAKRSIDSVIDICDDMQNLREAILPFKVQSESTDKSPMQRAAAYNRGVHYLRRYYQLVEFIEYVFSISPEDRASMASFNQWLQGRQELRSINKRIILE